MAIESDWNTFGSTCPEANLIGRGTGGGRRRGQQPSREGPRNLFWVEGFQRAVEEEGVEGAEVQ